MCNLHISIHFNPLSNSITLIFFRWRNRGSEKYHSRWHCQQQSRVPRWPQRLPLNHHPGIYGSNGPSSVPHYTAYSFTFGTDVIILCKFMKGKDGVHSANTCQTPMADTESPSVPSTQLVLLKCHLNCIAVLKIRMKQTTSYRQYFKVYYIIISPPTPPNFYLSKRVSITLEIIVLGMLPPGQMYNFTRTGQWCKALN